MARAVLYCVSKKWILYLFKPVVYSIPCNFSSNQQSAMQYVKRLSLKSTVNINRDLEQHSPLRFAAAVAQLDELHQRVAVPTIGAYHQFHYLCVHSRRHPP